MACNWLHWSLKTLQDFSVECVAVLQMTNCHLHASLLRYLLSYYGTSAIFMSHNNTCNEVAAVVHFAQLADIACDPIVHGYARPPDGLNLLKSNY